MQATVKANALYSSYNLGINENISFYPDVKLDSVSHIKLSKFIKKT